jgi:S1-C subfamily serine protease
MSRVTPFKYWVVLAALVASVIVLITGCAPAPVQPDYASAQRANPIIQTTRGSGSGVVVRRTNVNGQTRLFVWTAAHVVRDMNEVKIESRVRNEFRKVGNVTFTARPIFRDAKNDLALLWLDAPDGYFDYVRFDSVNHPIGTEVYHVGNFLGSMRFDDSVSWGRVSNLGIKPEEFEGWPWANPIDQADMVILPGSSGGGLFSTESRRVIGIVVGWPTMPGVCFYVPLRTLVSVTQEAGYDWAVYGGACPRDSLLDKAVKTFTVEKKDEPVLTIEIKVEPPKPVQPAKPVPAPRKPKGW